MLWKVIFILLIKSTAIAEDIDPSGYLMYCPGMDCHENQADHFLGALAFAKALNRTLILPPWLDRSKHIPLTDEFMKKYHRIILMQDFMTNFADKLLPEEARSSFCRVERQSLNKQYALHGIHLRYSNDWVQMCEHIRNSQHLFGSPQCLGYNNEKKELYPDKCLPPKELVITEMRNLINAVGTYKNDEETRDDNHARPEVYIALRWISRMLIGPFWEILIIVLGACYTDVRRWLRGEDLVDLQIDL